MEMQSILTFLQRSMNFGGKRGEQQSKFQLAYFSDKLAISCCNFNRTD